MGTRIWPYAVVGVVITVLVTTATLWTAYHPPVSRGATPVMQLAAQLRSLAAAIGLALLVLAWAERNRALAWFSLGYLVIVLTPTALFASVNAHPSVWGFLPHLLVNAATLLLGGLGFAAIRPTERRDAR